MLLNLCGVRIYPGTATAAEDQSVEVARQMAQDVNSSASRLSLSNEDLFLCSKVEIMERQRVIGENGKVISAQFSPVPYARTKATTQLEQDQKQKKTQFFLNS